MKMATIFISILLASSWVIAGDAARDKYRNLTPEEINALSLKERDSVPTSYLIMATRASYSKGQLEIKAQLQKLMYSGLQDYVRAVRDFQKDIGEPVTGTLTIWQLTELEYRSQMQTIPVVSFPNGFDQFFSFRDAYVAGMMVTETEATENTINYAWIQCDRSKEICSLSEIYMEVPVKGRGDARYNISQAEPAVYRVTRWDVGRIEAVLVKEKPECMRSSISLDFRNEQYQLSKKNIVPQCGFVVHRGKTEPLVQGAARIVDGRDIIRDRLSRLFDSRGAYLSSAFRRQEDDARKEKLRRLDEPLTNVPPPK